MRCCSFHEETNCKPTLLHILATSTASDVCSNLLACLTAAVLFYVLLVLLGDYAACRTLMMAACVRRKSRGCRSNCVVQLIQRLEGGVGSKSRPTAVGANRSAVSEPTEVWGSNLAGSNDSTANPTIQLQLDQHLNSAFQLQLDPTMLGCSWIQLCRASYPMAGCIGSDKHCVGQWYCLQIT